MVSKIKVLVLALGCLAVAAGALAESERDKTVGTQIGSFGITRQVPSSKFRLIDPGRLQQWNQLIFSFDSSGRDSFQGLYLSTFDYRLARPLDISVTLGARLTPGSGFDGSAQGSFFLSGMRLRYQPSESMLIQFQYRDPRGMVPNYYYPYATRWWPGD